VSYDPHRSLATDCSVGRYYDPQTGQFLSVDPAPVMSAQYQYSSDDPVDNSDPTGTSTLASPKKLTQQEALKILNDNVLAPGTATGTEDPDVQAKVRSMSPSNFATWYTALVDTATKGLAPAHSGCSSDSEHGTTVTRWNGVITCVLKLLHLPANGQYVTTVDRVITGESEGESAVINTYDVNYLAGMPSTGLVQVIWPTFEKYRSRSLSANPFNPAANIYAGAKCWMKGSGGTLIGWHAGYGC